MRANAAGTLSVLLGVGVSLAQASTEKPQFQLLTRPTPEEMRRGLKRWERDHPDRLRIETRGHTAQGRLLLCRVTDYGVPDEDKEHVLIDTPHAGAEFNTVTSALHFVKWLISDNPLAAEICRKQVVLVMPNENPDGYVVGPRDENSVGGDPRWYWTWDGVTNQETNPEGVALQGVIDEYMPEAFVSLHGVWCEGQTMQDCTGTSVSSGLDRPYIPRIWELMDEEAEREGFIIGHWQEGFKVRATAPVPEVDYHLFTRSPVVLSLQYAYHQYHTIAMTIETGWEDSTLARLRGLLRIGNRRWRGEYYAGYPTRQVAGYGLAAVVAYGTTAAQRRASRVELWQKLRQIRCGIMHPEPIGQAMCLCATTPQGAQKYLGETDILEWVELFRGDPQFDYDALREFVYSTKAIHIDPGYVWTAPEPIRPVEHGIALRIWTPYTNPTITHIRLDGHAIPESESDGYIVYHEPGTTVQVNVPPEEVRDFHFVTWAYEPDVKRKSGFRPEDW